MMEPRRLLHIGALLHDVGELVARASSPSGAAMDHGALGANWLRAFVDLGLPTEVADMAAARESGDWEAIRNDPLALVAYHADRWLCAEAGESGGSNEPTVLRSVFSLCGGQPLAVTVEPESGLGYPAGQPPSIDIAAAIAAFGEAMRRWVQAGCHRNGLLALLERFWSGLPSRSGEHLCLYDGARLTCAISSALYECLVSRAGHDGSEAFVPAEAPVLPADEPYFCLVAGRLVGSEEFVERRIVQGDVCASIGRAFYVRLVGEHAADDILGRLHLCAASALYRTDGEFVLLCPNVPQVGPVLDEVSAAVDRRLLRLFGPTMHLALASAPAPWQELSGVGVRSVLAALDAKLAHAAGRPAGPWLAEALEPRDPGAGESGCDVCGSDTDPELAPQSSRTPDVKACRACREFAEVGARLLSSSGVSAASIDAAEAEPLWALPKSDGGWTHYEVALGDAAPGAVQWHYVLPDAGHSAHVVSEARAIPFARYIRSAAHLPKAGRTGDRKRRHEVASLRALAKSARGSSRLGVLRLDVDDTFGRVWAQARDLAGFAATARALTRFFDLHVPAICGAAMPKGLQPRDVSEKGVERGVGRNVTLVRSSGDDLLLVGAWDETIELAIDLREAFRVYTAGGAMTVSAALTLGGPDAALLELSREADRGVSLAKSAGGDRCAPFHCAAALARPAPGHEHWCYTWGQLVSLVVAPVQSFKMAGRMSQNRFDARLPNAFAARLLAIVELWEREGAVCLPRMVHLVKQLKDESRGDTTQTQRHLMDPSKMPGLRSVVTWLDLLGGKA